MSVFGRRATPEIKETTMADSTENPVREQEPRTASTPTSDRREFKVAERREDGTVVLDLGDNRMAVATVKDGVEGIRKGGTVTITATGFNDGVPEGAEVIKAG